MIYRTATPAMAAEIQNVLHTTIKTVYSKYYPKEVVDFFCNYHNREHILAVSYTHLDVYKRQAGESELHVNFH